MIAPTDMTSELLEDRGPSPQPSDTGSLYEFDRDFSPTLPEMPSQHSGFRSNNNSVYSEESCRSASPPVWRKHGSGWFRHQQALMPHPQFAYISHEPSPAYFSAEEESDDVLALQTARSIPLPESPVKGRTPMTSPEPDEQYVLRQRLHTEAREPPSRYATPPEPKPEPEFREEVTTPSPPPAPVQINYIRFSTSLDVMQRTEPIEAAVATARKLIAHATKSKYNTFLTSILTLAAAFILASLMSTPSQGPSPDLLMVAGYVRSLEPMIYYSENGVYQISELDDTSRAVWDLRETVRLSNMTSGPMITEQLDELHDGLNFLGIELTSFFSALEGDYDHILSTMEWTQRELSALSSQPPTAIQSVWSNAHTLVTSSGLVSPSSPIIKALLGETYHQTARATLNRAFHELLGALEASITNELSLTNSLYGLFEGIDHKFLNLQRTVIREQVTQERLENEVLSSLWTRLIGGNASRLGKFERNKTLLKSVRDRTNHNKAVLADHRQRLLTLRTQLEELRRKLVGPLLQSAVNASSLTVHDQLRGLDDTYHQLREARESQRRKMLARQFGPSGRRLALSSGDGRSIEEHPDP